MPFPPSDFPLDGFQDDIAKRALLLARVPAQLVMQLLWYVFDLNIRHAGTLACPGHAGNLDRIDSTLAWYAPNLKLIKVQDLSLKSLKFERG